MDNTILRASLQTNMKNKAKIGPDDSKIPPIVPQTVIANQKSKATKIEKKKFFLSCCANTVLERQKWFFIFEIHVLTNNKQKKIFLCSILICQKKKTFFFLNFSFSFFLFQIFDLQRKRKGKKGCLEGSND